MVVPAKPRLGELLVGAGLLSQADLDEVLRKKEPGQKIGRALVDRGLVTEQQLTQALSQLLSVPWVSLYHIDFSKALLARVPRELAERFGLVPIFVRNVKGQGETLYVATDDPTNDHALAEVASVAGLPTRPMIASTSDIQATLRTHYGANSLAHVVIRDEAAVTRPEGTRRAVTTAVDREREHQAKKVASAPLSPPSSPSPSPAPSPAPSPPPSPDAGVVKTDGPARRSAAQRRRSPAFSLTLLDGTKVVLPAAEKQDEDSITARDLVSALRARAHGADAAEILGADPKWEAFMSALLAILLRKGLLTDRELVEELSKF